MLLFVLLLFIQEGYWMLKGCEKNGFDIDEIFTYGLSNAYQQPFIEVPKGEWISGTRFADYLSVGNHAHEYLNVYENQIADVHPPLYYLCMHAICSVFRNAGFTKWTGIVLNMVSLAVAQTALFMLGCLLLTNRRTGGENSEGSIGYARWEALIPVLFYGFGAGATSNVIFIRMYAMMTMWVTLLALVLVVMWQRGQTLGYMRMLTAVLILGFLTQYYFVIISCFLCAGYFFARLNKRQGKAAAQFAGRCLCALMLAVGLFPWCLKHIFSGYRGVEAFERAAGVHFADMTRWYHILFDILSAQQFGGHLAVLLILGAVFAVFPSGRLRRWNAWTGDSRGMALLALAGCMGYMAVIAVISPYKVDRYIFCIYPLMVLAVFLLLRRGGLCLSGRETVAGIMAFAILGISGFPAGHTNYLFTGEQQYVNICEAHSDMPCIVLGDNDMTLNILELAAFKDICVLDKDDADMVVTVLKELEQYDWKAGFVLFERYPDDAVVEELVRKTGMQSIQTLYTHQYRVFLLR